MAFEGTNYHINYLTTHMWYAEASTFRRHHILMDILRNTPSVMVHIRSGNIPAARAIVQGATLDPRMDGRPVRAPELDSALHTVWCEEMGDTPGPRPSDLLNPPSPNYRGRPLAYPMYSVHDAVLTAGPPPKLGPMKVEPAKVKVTEEVHPTMDEVATLRVTNLELRDVPLPARKPHAFAPSLVSMLLLPLRLAPAIADETPERWELIELT